MRSRSVRGMLKYILTSAAVLVMVAAGRQTAQAKEIQVQNSDGTAVIYTVPDDTSAELYYADENESELPLATNLKWDELGRFSFQTHTKDAFYFAEIMRDDQRVTTWHMGQPRTADGTITIDTRYDLEESGNYKIRVKTGKDDNDYSFDSGSITEYSDVFQYTRPDKSLPAPTNVRWDPERPGTLLWNTVEGAAGYNVSLHDENNPDRHVYNGWSYYSTSGESDLSFILGDFAQEQLKVTATVRALSGNPMEIANGVFSEKSAAFDIGDLPAGKVKKAAEALETATTAQEAEAAVKALQEEADAKEMQMAMQTQSKVRDQVKALEDSYKDKAGISVSTTVTDKAELPGTATILGAALNAKPGAQVEFKIDRADEKDSRAVDTNIYKNIQRFDMSISDVEMDAEGNLKFPVTVTIPVPSFIQNRMTARILHYHHSDDGFDLIMPIFNSDNTMSFTVTHFSEVAVAQMADQNPQPSTGKFIDVPDSKYYAKPVAWAVEKNITNGTSDNTFSPESSCTRGQIVTFLWRANGQPEPSNTNNPFTDVVEGKYYYKAVLWAVEKGITSGKTATTFDPNGECTRAQTVTFLWRSQGSPSTALSDKFADVPANAYYAQAVAWAGQKGITQGTTATTFEPNQGCTRGQVVTFLYRSVQ